MAGRRPPTRSRSASCASDRIRAVVGTAEWTALGIRLGMLDLVATARRRHPRRAPRPRPARPRLGPADAAWPTFGATRSGPIGERPARPAAARRDRHALGSESLFLAALHPWTPVGELDRRRLERARRAAPTGCCRSTAGRAVQGTTGSLRPGRDGLRPRPVGAAVPALRRRRAGRDDRPRRRRTARCSTARPARAASRRPTTAGPAAAGLLGGGGQRRRTGRA